MNTAVTNIFNSQANVISINSGDIADLVGRRHDNVKRTIESLACSGVITFPQIEEKPTAGRPVAVYVFSGDQGKRDSIVVVAQLCPEFTARLVDRWQELEAQVAKPQLPQNFAEALMLAAQLEQQRERLEAVTVEQELEIQDRDNYIEVLQPKANFADTVVEAVNDIGVGLFAKQVGMGQNKLFEWLRDKGFLMATRGCNYNLPYGQYTNTTKWFRIVKAPKVDSFGNVRDNSKTVITPLGQQRLHKKLWDAGLCLNQPTKGGK